MISQLRGCEAVAVERHVDGGPADTARGLSEHDSSRGTHKVQIDRDRIKSPAIMLDGRRQVGGSQEVSAVQIAQIEQGHVSKVQPSWYRGTSLIRKRFPLEPYRRLMPRVLGWS